VRKKRYIFSLLSSPSLLSLTNSCSFSDNRIESTSAWNANAPSKFYAIAQGNIPARGVVHTCGLRPRWERLHLLPRFLYRVLVCNSPRSVAVISVNPKLAAIALVICAFARQYRRVELRCRVTLHDNARRTVKDSPTLLHTRVFVRRAKNRGNNVRELDVRIHGQRMTTKWGAKRFNCVHLENSSYS